MRTILSNRANMINSTLTYCGATRLCGDTAFALIVGIIVVLIFRQRDFCLKCSKGTRVFAKQTNNNALAALVKYTKTDLERATKEDVDDLCENIYDGTSANIALLPDLGFAADVTDLGTVDFLGCVSKFATSDYYKETGKQTNRSDCEDGD